MSALTLSFVVGSFKFSLYRKTRGVYFWLPHLFECAASIYFFGRSDEAVWRWNCLMVRLIIRDGIAYVAF